MPLLRTISFEAPAVEIFASNVGRMLADVRADTVRHLCSTMRGEGPVLLLPSSDEEDLLKRHRCVYRQLEVVVRSNLTAIESGSSWGACDYGTVGGESTDALEEGLTLMDWLGIEYCWVLEGMRYAVYNVDSCDV